MEIKERIAEYRGFIEDPLPQQLNVAFYDNMARGLIEAADDKAEQVKEILFSYRHHLINNVGIEMALDEVEKLFT